MFAILLMQRCSE